MKRLRLPILGDRREPEDDPFVLLRGGRFARWFASSLAVLGLAWVVSARVAARDADVVLVHTALENYVVALAAPPQPPVEDITPPRAPPPAAIEDIPPRAPPRRPDDPSVTEDRFGRKRTGTGALVLSEEGEGIVAPEGLPDQQLGEIKSGGFFDPKAFDDVKTVKKKAYVHLMPGIPNEAFFAGVILILLLSFTVFERNRRQEVREYWKFELTKWSWLHRAIKSRWFQPAIQLPVVIMFLAVIVIGLVGSQEPGRNLAPVLTWNIWWIGLIFMVLLFGNLWCHMCPWTAIPDWFMRRGFTPVRKIASLNRKYPRFKLWMWPAIVLFALVTWLEIIFDAANRPWLTSALGIFMIVLSWIMLVIYERKAMCRYVCFVGRVSGQYAMMGMVELRRRDNEVCRRCQTKDCFHGNERGYPCPTHEFMGAMNENQFCTLCTECVKSCPHDNIGLNVRRSGSDVLHKHRSHADEAYMALLIFIVSAFHGAAMIPLWMEWENGLRGAILDAQVALFGSDVLGFGGSHGGTMTFTLMMLACIVGPGVLYWLLCAAMRLASGRPDIGTRKLFIKFSYTLLPIALFYHLAHNAVHVFWEWSKLRRLISDPLGWDHDFFGTARAPLTALWSPESIWYLQVALVVIGHIYGIYVAQREASRLYGDDRKAALRVHIIMMIGMIAMSMLSLWLLAQPMFMRTADM
ncbi:MAG: 4Fe-4S binding protein [Myxococcales bacterium]|nr:4Fe-4S binding protein [Myxococcales bacterium]